MDESVAIPRAQGCLLGQLAGDALGSLVEFKTPREIRRRYPGGVRELAAGGTWDTVAGQPTDDSEMALALARSIADHGGYDVAAVRQAYRDWLDSRPFDCGATVSAGLQGHPNPDSQANGALMRISPLAIFGAAYDPVTFRKWAMADAALTHPHPICQQANSLYVYLVANAIRSGWGPADLYGDVLGWLEQDEYEPALVTAVRNAAEAPPEDYVTMQGWVLIALQNALFQMLHADSLEAGVVDTAMRGGDTDTNAAIAGALLGAIYGREAIPAQWARCLAACRPQAGLPGVRHPRPPIYWPVDAPDLAERLLRHV